LHTLHTDSITGTSTSTPTTVASAAPEPGPNKAICFCQPKSMAAQPEKFTLVPPPGKQKGVEHPPTGLNNPFWN
jgi:hypothetical protein